MLYKFAPDNVQVDSKWLVRNLVPLGHLCVLLAQSGVGKSFVLENLALCVACDKPFCGLETEHGEVLIIDQDTPTDVLNSRLLRYSNGLRKIPENLTVASMCGYNLYNNRLPELISEHNPKLVIIDSLHSLCGRLNPNSTSDMSIWAKVKAGCLTPDRTIIVSHHITEKMTLSLEELMDSNSHISGMGNSTIKQQADTEYILASTTADSKVNRFYLRPVSKRQSIPQQPVILGMSEPDEMTLVMDFLGYYEAGLTEAETDILLLIRESPRPDYTIHKIQTEMGSKWSESQVRRAVGKLEKEGKLVMNRGAHNRFTFRLP